MKFAAMVLPLVAIVFLASGSGGGQRRDSALEQNPIRLPGQIHPQQLAIAGDGSVWIADGNGATKTSSICRLTPGSRPMGATWRRQVRLTPDQLDARKMRYSPVALDLGAP